MFLNLLIVIYLQIIIQQQNLIYKYRIILRNKLLKTKCLILNRVYNLFLEIEKLT